MFAREARWIGDRLAGFAVSEISPLLNVGSGTGDFRDTAQPWIARDIFTPLARRGVEVVHLDVRWGTGIDIRADLLDDSDFEELRRGRLYRALLCCNVLEHVADPAAFARRCAELVSPGGFVIVTVPRSYPHHRDPIDTLYRPTPDEAARLFPSATVLSRDIIDVGESYRDEVRRRPWILLRHIMRAPAPFLGFEKWRNSMRKPYWLFRNYQVTAVALRMPEAAAGAARVSPLHTPGGSRRPSA